MKFTVNKKVLAFSLAALGLSTTQLHAESEWQGKSRDAWIDGKLESSYLLNTELNNFKIDTKVENGIVTLEGEVPSEAHKELAEQIASNLDGVTSINNRLMVGDEVENYSDKERSFSTRFHDVTTTAALKSQFAVNSELDALDINIDTVDGVVTLNGAVHSEAEKALAEEIAEGKEHVKMVQNKLIIVQR